MRKTAFERFVSRLSQPYIRWFSIECQVCKDWVKKERMWRWRFFDIDGNSYIYFCLKCCPTQARFFYMIQGQRYEQKGNLGDSEVKCLLREDYERMQDESNN